MKTRPLSLSDLAYGRAFDFISSHDPEVSMRFYIPVGNWMDAGGNVREDRQHNSVVWAEGKNAYRFTFTNYTDNRTQGANVDGSGVIVIGGIKPSQLDTIFNYISSNYGSPEQMNAADHLATMEWMQTQLGIKDFYNDTLTGINKKMQPFSQPIAGLLYGGYIPQPHLSAAIAYSGEVAFNLLSAAPQTYENGAFATFPTYTTRQLQSLSLDKLVEDMKARKVTPRAVEAARFCSQNTHPDGSKILLP